VDNIVTAVRPEEEAAPSLKEAAQAAAGAVRNEPPTAASAESSPKPAPRYLTDLETDSYDLKYPIEWDGVEYRQVVFAPLKGGDILKFRNMALVLDEDMVAIHLITGLPVEVAQFLMADDYVEVLERSVPFVPAKFQGDSTDEESPTDSSIEQT